jgi:hypothetical protein
MRVARRSEVSWKEIQAQVALRIAKIFWFDLERTQDASLRLVRCAYIVVKSEGVERNVVHGLALWFPVPAPAPISASIPMPVPFAHVAGHL